MRITRTPLFAIITTALVAVPLALTVAHAQASTTRPWVDTSKTPAQRTTSLLAAMSTTEKIALVTANYTPLAYLGIPALNLADTSSGVRGQAGVTAFPVPEALAASFDTTLARRYGDAIAAEARDKGFNGMLAPTVDIIRSGLSGRQTETFSEDPLLSGTMGAQVAAGMKGQNVVTTVKHYGPYNQETNRDQINVKVSDRALHEIYNAPAQAVVTQGGADALMCSYPKVNGTYACQNQALLAALRSETGWQGLVMSDYAAGDDRVAGFNAGVDTTALWPGFPTDAFTSGAITATRLDEAASRILRAMFASGAFDHPLGTATSGSVSTTANQTLATQVAEDSTVLLKNSGQMLPLRKNVTQRVAVIGPSGTDAITGVNGSSYVDPGTVVTPLKAITTTAGTGATVVASQGTLGDIGLATIPATALRAPDGTSGLLGTFYPSADLTGTAVTTAVTSTVDVAGAPVSGLPSTWSARWTGTLTPTATGLVRLSAVTSGAVKIWVNGTLVISGGRSFTNFLYGPGTYPLQGVTRLTAGTPVNIVVEYSTQSPQGTGYFGPELHLGWQPTSMIADAVTAAKNADVAVVYVNQRTGEGMDRDSYDLPGDQNQLIDAVASANPNTVVVLNTPGAVLMPWLSKVKAVLQVWYPGMAVGTATAAVLFGDADPAGRLPVTFPASNAQRPTATSTSAYPGTSGTVSYDEDVFVGYRRLLQQGQTPLFPFGYGLSYTTFTQDTFVLGPFVGDAASAQVTVHNTGTRAGSQVVQVYVGALPTTSVSTPNRQLAGYSKVTLNAGESRTISIPIPRRMLSYWDTSTQTWVTPKGATSVYIGTSVATTSFAGTLSAG